MTAYKTMKNDAELQKDVQSIRFDRTRSRRIGEALESMVKVFTVNKPKDPEAKMILFLFVRGRTYGCLYKLLNAVKALKNLGVRVYAFGFGTRCLMEELAMITLPERVFRY